MFLSTPEFGGETVFADMPGVNEGPEWSECARKGLAVHPKKGNAVRWGRQPIGRSELFIYHSSAAASALMRPRRASAGALLVAVPEQHDRHDGVAHRLPGERGRSLLAAKRSKRDRRFNSAPCAFRIRTQFTRKFSHNAAACPLSRSRAPPGPQVVKGEKWSAPKWLRTNAFQREHRTAPIVEPCIDLHANCKDWAAQGECEGNPAFMTGERGAIGQCRVVRARGWWQPVGGGGVPLFRWASDIPPATPRAARPARQSCNACPYPKLLGAANGAPKPVKEGFLTETIARKSGRPGKAADEDERR